MKTRVALAAILALIFCLQPGVTRPAFACTCGIPKLPRDALASADAVFSGKVISVSPLPTNTPSPYGLPNRSAPWYKVTFSVISVWKGVSRPEMTIQSGDGWFHCSYDFNPGDTYLVYAHEGEPRSEVFSIGSFRLELPAGGQQLDTGICTRTAPLAQAALDLAQLGPGTQPAQGDLLGLVLDNLLAAVALAAALVIALVLYLVRRRRRRSFRLKP
jgi:hypothetical protein